MRCEAPAPSAASAQPAQATEPPATSELDRLRAAAKLAGESCKENPFRAQKNGCEAAVAWSQIERLSDPKIIPTLLTLLEDQQLPVNARLHVLLALDPHAREVERDVVAVRRLVVLAQQPSYRTSEWWPLARFIGDASTSASDVTASVDKLFEQPASSVFMTTLMNKAATRDPGRVLPQLVRLASKPLAEGSPAAVEVLGQVLEAPAKADQVPACRLLRRIILDRGYPRETRANAAFGVRTCMGVDQALDPLLTWARRETLGEGGIPITSMLQVQSATATPAQRKKIATIAQAALDNRNNETLLRVFALDLLFEMTDDRKALLARLANEPEPTLREKLAELRQTP